MSSLRLGLKVSMEEDAARRPSPNKNGDRSTTESSSSSSSSSSEGESEESSASESEDKAAAGGDADATNDTEEEAEATTNKNSSPPTVLKSIMAQTGKGKGETNGGRKSTKSSTAGKKRSAEKMTDSNPKASVPKLKDGEIESKIEAFLRSRCRPETEMNQDRAVEKAQNSSQQQKGQCNNKRAMATAANSNGSTIFMQSGAPQKQCRGPCGLSKVRNAFSVYQWTYKNPLCLVCSVGNELKAKKAASSASSKVPLMNDEQQQQQEDEDDGLPPIVRSKNGDSPFGRIRSCQCSKPSVCRDIMWRWARLKEGKYISYLTLPHSQWGHTAVGKHVNAYHNGVLRHLGYDLDSMENTRTIRYSNGREITRTVKMEKAVKHTTNSGIEEHRRSNKRISSVHFHPDVYFSYLGRNMELIKGNKENRWRIPVELGARIGLKEEDKCPTLDSNGEPSYFALPNYSLEEATKDVEKAEEEYKRKFKEFKELNERVTANMVEDPTKYVMEIHDLKQQVANLTDENNQLKEKMKAKTAEQNAFDKKSVKLQKGLEQVARRLDTWENTSMVGKSLPRCTARDIYKEATGRDLEEKGYYNVKPSGAAWRYGSKKKDGEGDDDGNDDDNDNGGKKDGRGGHRWSDPRMDRAVQAQWDDPALPIEDALRIGGFEFSESIPEEMCERETVDSDNVTLAQRKNNLRRRLRQRKKQAARNGGEPWVSKAYNEPRMDRATQAKWDNPSLSTAEALRIGGFEWEDQKGVLQKLIMVDNVSLDDRKRSILSRIRAKKKRMVEKATGGGGVKSGQPTKGNTEEVSCGVPGDEEDNDDIIEETTEKAENNIQMATVDDLHPV